jgi:hypothetical protein
VHPYQRSLLPLAAYLTRGAATSVPTGAINGSQTSSHHDSIDAAATRVWAIRDDAVPPTAATGAVVLPTNPAGTVPGRAGSGIAPFPHQYVILERLARL